MVHRNSDGSEAYWVVGPQPLGWRSTIFRVEHVEEAHLVGVFLTLKDRRRRRRDVLRSY